MAADPVRIGEFLTVSNSVIRGDKNTIVGSDNEIYGNGNFISGDRNTISGNANECTGDECKAQGNANKLEGNGCAVFGNGNTINGKEPDRAGTPRIKGRDIVGGTVPVPLDSQLIQHGQPNEGTFLLSDQRANYFALKDSARKRVSVFAHSLNFNYAIVLPYGSFTPLDDNDFGWDIMCDPQGTLELTIPSFAIIFSSQEIQESSKPILTAGEDQPKPGIWLNTPPSPLPSPGPIFPTKKPKTIPPPSDVSLPLLDPSLDTDTQDEKNACNICMQRLRCIVFNPCGHLACCLTCAHMMQKKAEDEAGPYLACPMCKQGVRSGKRVFL